MESAKPLYGDDFSRADCLNRQAQRRAHFWSAAFRLRKLWCAVGFRTFRLAPCSTPNQYASALIPKFELRPANWTSIRLGVKAPISRIIILGLALWAHREPLHRGVRSIIRERLDDTEPWPAVGAVGKRVQVAPVPGIENF